MPIRVPIAIEHRARLARTGSQTGGSRIKTDTALHPDRQLRDFCNFLQQYECCGFGSDATGFAAFGDQSVNVEFFGC